jgi:serine phosphatase RsbU (regulator of sigma subunit)
VPGLDCWVLSQPFQQHDHGGDIYFLGLCGHGLTTRLFLADVSGHGDQVAQLARRVRELLARHMNTPDQSQLVKEINDGFHRLGEGGRFATAVVLSYLSPNDRLVAVNAGHPYPLWYSAADKRWRLLNNRVPQVDGQLMNLPLGVLPETGYWQFAVPLSKDDLLVLYTDAATEVTNPAGRQLGQRGLLEFAGDLDPARPEEINDRLVERVCEYGRSDCVDDDLTLITVRHTAADPPNVEEWK